MREMPPVFRLFTGILEWSRVAKAMLLLAFLLPMVMQYVLWLLYVLSREDRDRLVDVAFAHAQFPVFCLLALLVVVLFAIGAAIRRRLPQSRIYEAAVLLFFSCSLLYYGWLIGTLSVEAGVVVIGSPIVGLILFSWRTVMACWALSCTVLLGMALAVAGGWMKYAPLLVLPTPGDETYTRFWVFSHLYWVIPHLVFTMLLAGLALIRWRQRERAFRTLSHTDELTRVHNRRSIVDRLEREMARMRRSRAPLSVLLADLDHFKTINDTWGHPTGDRVLRAAAAALQDAVREYDAVGRYGGEEFLVVLPDASPEVARRVAERCRERLAALRVQADNGDAVPVSGSIGLACNAARPDADPDMLVQRADQALYRAKQNGRNRVEAD
ncbi:MAG: GGDEF domain-containing protein [Pseudomonadota bacterium]